MKLNRKITDNDQSNKYITTLKFNKLTSENYGARLKQADWASKIDIVYFVNKADFDNKVKNVTSDKKELNELSKKFEAISTKGLTKDSTDRFSILHGAKYFSSEIFQN